MEDDSLYPPRDKAARRLWDTMNKFKKGGGGRKHGQELLLPPESGYLRACAHHFAERLGLIHKSTGEGASRTVLLQLPAKLDASAALQPEEPPSKRLRMAPLSLTEGDDAAVASAAAGLAAAGPVAPTKLTPEGKWLAAETAAEANRLRKPFMSRLTNCARDSDPARALAVFEDLRAAGLHPDNAMASLLLHLFGNAVPPMLTESRRVFAETQLGGGKLDEASWSGMIRLLCLHGELSEASAALDTMARAGLQLKLRSVSPLLIAACEHGELALATASCERLREHGLAPAAQDFVALVRLHTSRLLRHGGGAVLSSANANSAVFAAPSRGGADAADSAAGLNELLRWLADENPPLSDAHLAHLHASFDPGSVTASAEPASAAAGSRTEALPAVVGGAEGSSALVGPGLVARRWRAERCTVDSAGTCSLTRQPLRAIHISDASRAELCAVIPRLAGSRTKGEEFARFSHWVEEHGPFEYVLDGANIGYFGQAKLVKARAAAFSYGQVDAVLRSACSRSGRVLLVLHVSHTDTAQLKPPERELVQRWRERGVLFSSPAKHNDDWYWLYAAIASGDRCKVVSNDEMRDHHFGMLSPRSFLRWKERHVVHFSFRFRAAEPELEYPPVFTTAIQDHPGRSWLFPCAESRDWLLVRPIADGDGDEEAARVTTSVSTH